MLATLSIAKKPIEDENRFAPIDDDDDDVPLPGKDFERPEKNSAMAMTTRGTIPQKTAGRLVNAKDNLVEMWGW